MLCLNCVKANTVATGRSSTSPFCRKPKNTVVIITKSKIKVIIPGEYKYNKCLTYVVIESEKLERTYADCSYNGKRLDEVTTRKGNHDVHQSRRNKDIRPSDRVGLEPTKQCVSNKQR
jgi:hypothetical protein